MSIREEIHQVHVLARRRPSAPERAVLVFQVEAQVRGWRLTYEEAEEIARRILTAAEPPASYGVGAWSPPMIGNEPLEGSK